MAQENTLPALLISTGVIVGGYLLYKKFAATQLQEANNLRFKINAVNADPETNGAILSVNVLNPNSKEYSFKSVIGSLFIGGKQIASIKMFGNYTVRGNDTITLPLLAKPLAGTIAPSRAKFTNVYFQGVINVNDKPIPLTLKYAR